MSDIMLRSEFDVEVVQALVSDDFVCKAARVSTLGADSLETKESRGLLNFLMKNRHGSPFEHGIITWRISAPIFVWRELMRHRIASYNEQSGRYMELAPVFYIPPSSRPLKQIGKAGKYEFVEGDDGQQSVLTGALSGSYALAWDSYQEQLDAGIAKEVARMCLPLAVYSTAYVSMNPRGLMNFLSLRTKNGRSMFPSYPQWEIEWVARVMEVDFSKGMPITHAVWDENGRVCP